MDHWHAVVDHDLLFMIDQAFESVRRGPGATANSAAAGGLSLAARRSLRPGPESESASSGAYQPRQAAA